MALNKQKIYWKGVEESTRKLEIGNSYSCGCGLRIRPKRSDRPQRNGGLLPSPNESIKLKQNKQTFDVKRCWLFRALHRLISQRKNIATKLHLIWLSLLQIHLIWLKKMSKILWPLWNLLFLPMNWRRMYADN